MTDALAGAAAPAAPAADTPSGASSTPEQAPGATAAPGTPPTEGTTPEQSPRTFTQEELDAKIEARLKKERRKLERITRAETERDFYRNQVEGRATANPQGDSGRPKGPPNPKDFNDFDSYVDAKVEYLLESRMSEREAKRQEEHSSAEQQRAHAEHVSQVRERMSEGYDKYDDFEEVALNPTLKISKPMALAISESEAPADVLYHLGQNPAEAKRIAALPTSRQVVEISKIEAKLSQRPAPTKAPDPINPTNANAPSQKATKDMSAAEWMKWREGELAKQNQRAR